LTAVLGFSRFFFDMARPTQISAPVSKETRDLLERHSRLTGLKKGHLIESALRYHLRALEELPADVLVPARLVVSRKELTRLKRRLSEPGQPTAALKRLMRGDAD
jgi:uncharacterized protein (DUF1778 family)